MGRKPGHGPTWEGRRQEIIDLAADLFAAKGYASTGINELVEATGLGKGALYYYIGSKENLLVEIQDRVMIPLLALARAILELEVSAPVRLRLLSQAMLELILSRLDHIWVFEHDYRHLSKMNRAKVVERRHELEAVVRSLFADAQANGLLRMSSPDLAMLQFLNLHNHTYTWAASRKDLDAEKLSKEYCATLFFGWDVVGSTSGKLEAAVEEFRAEYDGPPLSGKWADPAAAPVVRPPVTMADR